MLACGALAACGSPQFAPKDETGPIATATPSAIASATAAPTASAAPQPSGSAEPPAPAPAPSAAKAPKKTIVARHVLIQWMGCKAADTKIVRTKEQARTVAQDVLRRLKAGEDFSRVVLDYSDEPGAGRRGGSLPPFGRGAMDKSFEEAAFALAPGELSGIVETQFGFHVIQRLE